MLRNTSVNSCSRLSCGGKPQFGKVVLVSLIICLLSISVQAKYGGGTGEPNNPYLISEPNHMQQIGADPNDWDKHFLLTANIDLSCFSGTEFNMIGDGGPAFTGVFDGNSFEISNFTYVCIEPDCLSDIGLFRVVAEPNAEIRDLGLIDPNINAGSNNYIGSLVGHLVDGAITGCYVQGGSIEGSAWVGGLVGANLDGTISNSYSSTGVSGDNSSGIGGLVGENYGAVYGCYSSGSVFGNEGIGGLAGRNNGVVNCCYSSSSVSGDDDIGGLVGGNAGAIDRCYSSGSVSGSGPDIGGLVGNGGPMVTHSFWDVNSSGQDTSDGGQGKTTAEMQTASTFIGWGCGELLWTLDEGNDYPRLLWENKAGEVITTGEGFAGGCGTEGNPYLISEPNHMQEIGGNPGYWDKYFLLIADIDLGSYTGSSFNIIGDGMTRFTGVFDGNDHTISNFTHSSSGRSCTGLFGWI